MTKAEQAQLDRIEMMLAFLLEARGINVKSFFEDRLEDRDFERSKAALEKPVDWTRP